MLFFAAKTFNLFKKKALYYIVAFTHL